MNMTNDIVRVNTVGEDSLRRAVYQCLGTAQPLDFSFVVPEYTKDWSVAGPILETHEINIVRNSDVEVGKPEAWKSHATKIKSPWGVRNMTFYGPTPMIAGMRCLLASYMGEQMLMVREWGDDTKRGTSRATYTPAGLLK